MVTSASTTKPFKYTPPAYFDASSRVPQWLQKWLADAFIFIMVHYNLWAAPFVALFYVLYQVCVVYVYIHAQGLSRRVLDTQTNPLALHDYLRLQTGNGAVAIVMVALYIPRFVDGAEYTAHGRPWQWLWETRLWRLCSSFLR